MRWVFNWIKMIKLRRELRSIWLRSAKSDNFEEEYFNRLLLPESKIEEDRRNAGE